MKLGLLDANILQLEDVTLWRRILVPICQLVDAFTYHLHRARAAPEILVDPIPVEESERLQRVGIDGAGDRRDVCTR